MCFKNNEFHKKINKKVNKPNIWNSENWLFDDVSDINIGKISWRSLTRIPIRVLDGLGYWDCDVGRWQLMSNLKWTSKISLKNGQAAIFILKKPFLNSHNNVSQNIKIVQKILSYKQSLKLFHVGCHFSKF